jgi:hypothetical protein
MAVISSAENAVAPGFHQDWDLEGEKSSLRHRILRLRTILRFVDDPRAVAGLREVIADAERRLNTLELVTLADQNTA